VQRAPDRGQRNVDDRRIEDDHELGDAEEDQGDPAAVAGGLLTGHAGAPVLVRLSVI
jgi:hypothetical protein